MRIARTRANGFTLVELLVVVAVISLLVGILVPVVKTVIDSGENAKSMARIVELGDGCLNFKLETGYYPGQANFAALTGNNGSYTGSQVLAAGLFGCSLADLVSTTKAPPMSGKYAPIKVNDLDKFYSGSAWTAKYYPGNPSRAGTILDRFSDGPLAVLYYPCRLNVASDDVATLYPYNDNSAYVDPLWADYRDANDKPTNYTQSAYRTEMIGRLHGAGYGGTAAGGVKNRGGFMILGAGKDRLYLTGDDLSFR